MAIKTKYTFPNASGANGQSTTVFANHGIELNNQDDLDVYVYLSTTGRVLQYRQSTGSTTDSNHPQVNDTTGLYFPSVSTGVTLYNYTLSTDFNTITFNSAIPTGGIVSVERRTRDSSSNYTNFTSGGSIRSTELNSAFDESNFTAQEARNKAFDLENKLLYSNYTPYKDNTIDLGSSTYQWKDLWIDGTAHLDAVDINAGSIDGTTIGGSTPAAGTFSNLVVTGTISDSGGNLELNDDVNISGHLRFPDDKKIYLGNGDDAYIDWDTDGWFDGLHIESAGDIQFKAASGKKYTVWVDSAIPLQIFETYISNRVDIKPYPSNAVDLGKSDGQWKDLYVDGTGYIDTVSADNLTVSGTTTLAAGSINTSEIADDAVTAAKLASNSVVSASIVDGTIVAGDLADNAVTTAKINADAITGAKIADDQINSEHYVDGSIDTAHIADDQITNAKIATNAVNADSIAANAVGASELADNAVDTAAIADNAVTTDEINDGAVTLAKVASNAIGTSQLLDSCIQSSKLQGNSVTTDKIADAELTTLAGMQSGTASKLADSTALTADIADLNQIDGLTKQTTISDSDASFPTSGAVVDYVASQLDPVGGLEVIATDAAFPNTQPASGVVVSIADAGGLVVNGSGVSTTGRTVGGSTVTINNINSQFNSTTIDNGVAMMVSSTGSGQTYNYHKATLREQDILSISSDIQSFGNRYRVGSSNPTSDNDAGDLFFNTATDKLLVRNAANNSWDEAQSVGNFYISTLSPAFNGVLTEFTITNAPTYASQVLLIINGVLQKPNSGTSAPADGFALDGSTVKLGGAPATGSTYSAVVIGSTVNIGTPSDNTVSAAVLQSGSVTTAKIAADAVDGTKIADDAVGAEHIEVLDANLQFADNAKAQFGTTDNDLEIYHNGSHSYISDTGTGALILKSNDFNVQSATGETMIWGDDDAAVKLYYDGNPKFETTSTGVKYTGDLRADDDYRIKLGTSQELNIYHHNSGVSVIENTDQVLKLRAKAGEDGILINPDAAVELYWGGTGAGKKLDTYQYGVNVTGNITTTSHVYWGDNGEAIFGADSDAKIYHTGSHWIMKNTVGDINIAGDIVGVTSSDNSKWQLRCQEDAGVKLYYDGATAAKFETRSGGVAALGDVHCDSDTAKFKAGLGSDLTMYHDGSHSYIDNATGTLYLRTPSNLSFMTNSNEDAIQCIQNGAVKLFHDNVLRLATSAAGLNVTGDDSNYDTIKLECQTAGGDPSISFGRYGFSTTNRGAAIKYQYVTANTQEQGHLDFYTNPSFNSTGSLNHRLRIASNGDLEADDTTIGSLSDSRLKKNVTDYTYDLAKFKQLKPKTFDWINPEEHIRDTAVRGFVAQDLKTVDDYYVRDTDAINKKDKELITDNKALTSKLGANDAMYVSVINQLIAKVETLETKVAALEAK